ncbi:MAG: DNA polymerase I [Bacteroidales bacterium]|nr:DNA polymerase I [Bacteroidales bacterium]
MPKKLFLLDAMSLIYRAYYALNKNPRITSKGINTSATYGFANTLVEILEKEKPTHMAVCFDTKAATVRHDSFAEYKAHREETPEDIINSLPHILKLLEGFNISVLMLDGYEADDVIGTIAKVAEQKDFVTYIMTSDKDLGQLVSDKVFIYKPAKFGEKAKILGVKEVCERFGIKRPEQIIEILALQGDKVDNIPGIPGIGEKTATKLIAEYDNVENLLKSTHLLKDTLKEKIEKNTELAIMSKELATIITNVPVDFDEEKLKLKSPDKDALQSLFTELEFRRLAQRILYDKPLTFEETTETEEKNTETISSENKEPPIITEEQNVFVPKENINSVAHNYILIDTSEKRKEFISILKQQKLFCFDTETTGLDSHNSELVGMSFSFKPHEAYYIPFPENYNDAYKICNEFKEIFENEKIEKVGQNIKFDIAILKWYDIEVGGKLFDTMLAHYVLQPESRHNMDFLASTYLDYEPVSIETLIGAKGKNQQSMRTVPDEILKEYSCEDADITLQLKNTFEPKLAESNALKLFEEIEAPLTPVLAAMEAEGIKIDSEFLNDYSVLLEVEVKQLEKEIIQLAGVEFNISSPKQLGEILFEKLNIIEKAKLTKTKQYSTSEDVLKKLINKHEIIPKLLDYRSLTKLKSTYIDAFPLLVNPRTGRVHTSFNQIVTSTGRLSSTNPNIQNIPVRTERGKEIRKAFIPRNENYLLLSADYSQTELRIMAEMSEDKDMLEAFRQGIDIHTATASKVYGVSIENVTKEMRRNAKTINFGIIYGISGFGLSERLGIPRKEAGEIIKQYFEKYPGVKKYMDKSIEMARQKGYTETIMGRRRYLRDINSGNSIVRGYAERNAINAPIQGSAADMIKIAMINIYKEFINKKFKSKLILQVHDELVFDVKKDELEIVSPIIKDKMINSIKTTVPIDVDMRIGKNWLELNFY